jgi:hypothetical protein
MFFVNEKTGMPRRSIFMPALFEQSSFASPNAIAALIREATMAARLGGFRIVDDWCSIAGWGPLTEAQRFEDSARDFTLSRT